VAKKIHLSEFLAKHNDINTTRLMDFFSRVSSWQNPPGLMANESTPLLLPSAHDNQVCKSVKTNILKSRNNFFSKLPKKCWLIKYMSGFSNSKKSITICRSKSELNIWQHAFIFGICCGCNVLSNVHLSFVGDREYPTGLQKK